MRTAALLFSIALTACYASSPGTADGAVDPGPPKCPFSSGALAYDPGIAYPFCQWEGPDGFDHYCPSSAPDGWGYANWHTDDSGHGTLCHNDSSCDTCICYRSCSTAPPPGPSPDGGPITPTGCATPETGTAIPTCVVGDVGSTRGQCYLMCEHGERCPDGMRCVQDPPDDSPVLGGRWLCAWAVGDDRCSL